MEVEVKKRTASVNVVKIKGEIDLYQSSFLRQKLSAYVDDRPTHLIINLKDVDYIDSSGLAVFIEAFQKLRTKKKQIVLCALQKRIQEILSLARLNEILTVADTEQHAARFIK